MGETNAAFRGTYADENWIELFHSRPGWKICQISFQKDDESWVSFGSYRLIDATNVRPGFRVFRVRAKAMQFRLANGSQSVVDSNNGKNYQVHGPGRYVVESGSGCRRVSDAQIADCRHAFRRNDRFIEILFAPSFPWRNCFVTFVGMDQRDEEWQTMPMLMEWETAVWCLRLEASAGILCAFNNGCDLWDSNDSQNYTLALPGKYLVGCGKASYLGIAEADSVST